MKDLAEASKTIKELRRQLRLHDRRLEAFEAIFQASGLPGLWCSPQQAADLLGVSRDRVMTEVKAAEAARTAKQKCICKYGQHYRDVRKSDSVTPTWQIQVAKFEQLLNTPPDER